MENHVWIALPGRWRVRLATLLSGRVRPGESAAWPHPSRAQERDAHPATMQTIERASAHYQEKLGFSILFFSGEFRQRC